MKVKSIATGVVIAVLAGAAAYPHVNAYLKSLPQKMTKEQAGKRYLQAVCPDGDIVKQMNKTMKKYKEETSKYYLSGSDELDRANARVGALNNNIISLTHRRVDTLRNSTKKLTDPKFIWPEDVKKDIETVADENFAYAGELAAFLENGGKMPPSQYGNAADQVRRKLNLPVRGVCPANLLK